MSKRRREAVIRFSRYNKEVEPSNWYRAKLMLYFPWYNDETDYDTYEEHYHNVVVVVSANEANIQLQILKILIMT